MLPPDRVFLVPSGYNFRAVLAFCRALRSAGSSPAIVACTTDDPIFRTSFARDVVYTRAGRALETADFAMAVCAACLRSGATRSVLAPTSEYLIRWAFAHRAALADAGCDLPLPDETAYLRVTEKAAFTSFARDQGLPVPRELPQLVDGCLPAVAKPRYNFSPAGRSLYPWLLRTTGDLERFKQQENPADFFFQEWVDGRSFYLLFHLSVRGGTTVFSQENLAQQPGGKSILWARAANLHETPEAKRWADTLRAVGFHGLVMVELRQRGTDYVLIEANPRLWGPIQLCVDGCPHLLGSYIAEHTGIVPAARAAAPDRPCASYLWSGGIARMGDLVWHGPRPRFPRLALLGQATNDVYFRPDAWRHFFHELRRSGV
jgi:hypothetical protein